MFKTLDDYKGKKEEEKKQPAGKKDPKNTNSYAGGSKSGMEVENPLDQIVNKAKQNSESGEGIG